MKEIKGNQRRIINGEENIGEISRVEQNRRRNKRRGSKWNRTESRKKMEDTERG